MQGSGHGRVAEWINARLPTSAARPGAIQIDQMEPVAAEHRPPVSHQPPLRQVGFDAQGSELVLPLGLPLKPRRHDPRGRRWTVIELKAISKSSRADGSADGDGLDGAVRVGDGGAITAHWKYAFKREGLVACIHHPMSTIGPGWRRLGSAHEACVTEHQRDMQPSAGRLPAQVIELPRTASNVACAPLRGVPSTT